MSRNNVVISMDGHTEAFLDLKPWMPKHTHAAFDAAMAEGRRTFAGANRYWADLVYSGTSSRGSRRTSWCRSTRTSTTRS